MTVLRAQAIGAPLVRLDGPDKVRGTAPYAYEHPVDRPTYLYPLQAPIAVGRITRADPAPALAQPGVLAVLTHHNAPRVASFDNAELAILQSGEIAFRNQFVGGVVAETPEIARYAAGLVAIAYEERPHDVVVRPDAADLRVAKARMPEFPAETLLGDADSALSSAAVRVEATYRTPTYHQNPMEPHSTIAIWRDEVLLLWVGTQSVHRIRTEVSGVLGLDPERVRVISPHVGGGFGSKGAARPDVILAAMAARLVPGRPVKLAMTRRQMFSQVGHRPPTIQHVGLGAGDDGRLVAIAHDAIEETSRYKEFAEQSTRATPSLYAAPNRRTTQLLAPVDVPVGTIMRAPGEAPGMFALESAMDELAQACGVDPVELRVRNEPAVHPQTGLPFSSRNLVACLREGARRFGWEQRDPAVRARRESGWLVGTGVAASTYPVFRLPGSVATIQAAADGRYTVLIGAADIGTGTWTALTQIAADALGTSVEAVDLRIGDTALPPASMAGGSSGITSWGSTIVEAAGALRASLDAEHGGEVPPEGLEVTVEMPSNPHQERFAMHAYGAHFAEVRVREDSGEVRVPRLLGAFAAGRIINPKTGRSQLLGGMTWGISMALHEQTVVDPRFGHPVTQDLAEYHIATNADVGSIEVHLVDEDDPYVNPMGSKGIGELGIVGAPAAIANAVHHATGVRVRELPITLDKLLIQEGP
jgi:xanthine dehydrogenase YagR molybdenum-binding subunit